MKKSVLICAAAAAAMLAANAARAEEEDGVAVEGLVITANRSARRADAIGEAVTVLDKATIEASQAVAVSDLLAQTPGVSFSRNGGMGGATSVRIRGAESDQTVLVIDGVKLNDPSQAGGGYNFANLLTGDIERIEVLRGAQSTLWGSQAIGGVVNVVTVTPTEAFEAILDAEGGAMSTGYVRGGVGGSGERLVWRLSASHFETDGVSAFRGGAETDGFRHDGASGRAELRLTEAVSLDLRGVYTHGRNDFDGFPPPTFAFADTPELGKTTDLLAYGGVNLDLFGGRLQNRLAYNYTRTDRDLFDPGQAVTPVTFDARGENRRWEYQGVWAIKAAWNATFGAETEDARMRSVSPSSFDPTPAPIRGRAAVDSLYAQVQGEVLRDLTLTGGLRLDDHDTFGEHTVGQAAAAWSLGGTTILRASYGEGFKAPTLFQLFSEFGNVGLEPEEADSWDVGVERTWLEGALKGSATYFSRRTTNQIDFVSCAFGDPDPRCSAGGAPRFGYYDNTARTKAQGVEIAAAAQARQLSVQANYSWTEALNDTPGAASFGRFLPRRPEQQANLWATYVWPAGLATTVAVGYVGESFDNAANSVRLKGRTLVDLRASWPVNDGVEIYGRVENATDRDYQTTANYGSAGRAAYLGLRARF